MNIKIDRWPSKGHAKQDACYAELIRRGFKPQPGSSRYTRGFLVGRIEDGPGSGDTFFVTSAVDYPNWEARYANEDFDRAQALAGDLTDMDRHAGRTSKVGYSAERFNEANRIVRQANR
jgi:hypothetical protein